jgi:hypothetical protein
MSMQDLFAEAVERLKAGEPLAAVVAAYPADVQAELRELLTIVELTEGVAVEPLPQRSPRQRALARAQFLQQAGALRTEAEETLGPQALAAGTPAGTRPGSASPARNARPQLSWRERLAVGWGSFFDAPLLRLAPLAAVVAAVTLATFWTVRTAEAALPGDAVYPLKQWVREQRVNLAPPGERERAIRTNEDEVRAEVNTIATTMETRRDARAALSAEHSEPLVFYGRRGNLLLIGPFLVAPNYQPDPTDEDVVPMVIKGELLPGATVQLTYKVLPGNPNVVQGVAATVIGEPQPTPAPTATPRPASACRRTIPSDWVPYPVRAGDTLSALASRTGASAGTIGRVNCVAGSLIAGSTIYVPDSIYVRVTPTTMPTALPTVLPTFTPVPTITATPEPTATPQPPTTEPTEPTELPTGGPTAQPTGNPGDEPTGAPTGEPPATTTPGVTPGVTGEPATSTPAPTGQATGTPAPTADGSPTAQPTGAPTGEPAATATPGSEGTGTPPATPPGTPPDTPPATPAGETTGVPTSTPTSQANATPVGAPTAAATPTAQPTSAAPTEAPTGVPTTAPTSPPAPTAVPPTQPPPTEPPPPTQARPTPVPPTPVPPTPVPPTPVPPTETPATGDADTG